MAVPRLGDLTGGRAPGMDILRLGAATLVIVAHSYALTNHAEPLQRFGGPEFGDIAVAVFFAISGFLVTASWVSDPRLPSFVLRRALRILPALWVVLLLTTFVMGVVVTDVPVTASDGETLVQLILHDNASLETVIKAQPAATGIRTFQDPTIARLTAAATAKKIMV